MKVFVPPGKKPGSGSGGDILYGTKKFKNFELSIDWKTEKAGNSGIFYNVREVPGKPIYYAAPEVQVLDNVDATDNKIASHLAGSLYDILPADPKTVKPVGEWNTIVIRVKDGKVTHTQNGVKVVEYELWTPKWDEMVRTASSRRSRDGSRGSRRTATSGCRTTGTASGSGTSRFGSCRHARRVPLRGPFRRPENATRPSSVCRTRGDPHPHAAR